jgi:hypothetical protein
MALSLTLSGSLSLPQLAEEHAPAVFGDFTVVIAKYQGAFIVYLWSTQHPDVERVMHFRYFDEAQNHVSTNHALLLFVQPLGQIVDNEWAVFQFQDGRRLGPSAHESAAWLCSDAAEQALQKVREYQRQRK